MRSFNLLLALLACCCLSFTLVKTENNEITNTQFSHLKEGDVNGLPDDWVWKVFQDSRDFTWIGTHQGLVRWDGLTFREFMPFPLDSTSICGATIADILEDKEGYIWFAIHDRGLARFDPTTETFTNFRHKPHLDGLMRMIQDSEGIFWIGTYGSGMFRYDPETDDLTEFTIQSNFEYDEGENEFRCNSVVDIVEDIVDSNILWCAGNNGLFKFNKTTLQFEHFPSLAKGTKLMTINALKMDTPNKLWMAAWGAGMIEYDIPSGIWSYHTYAKPNMDNYVGYNDIVKGMVRKSPREFWIQTVDRGAGIFNTETKQFSFFENRPMDPTSINPGLGFRIFDDKEGRIWFCSQNNGVSYINSDCQAFFPKSIKMEYCEKKSANNITDFGFNPQSKQVYAIANGCDGLYEINPADGSYKTITTEGYENDYQIYSTLLVTKKGDIWVGGRSDRGDKEDGFLRSTLFNFDKQKGKLVPFKHPKIKGFKLQTRNIIDLYEDDEGIIWVATNDGDLVEINKVKNSIKSYSLDKWDTKAKKVQIAQIHGGQQLNIWVATSHGVFNFDLNTRTFKQLKGTIGYNINALAQDKTGRLWLGTKQEWLKAIDPKKPNQIITPNVGNQPFTLIDKIILDTDNGLWLTTQKGIYYLDKSIQSHSDGYFHAFSKRDGLVFNRFYQHGFMELPNGQLLVGKNEGYYSIDPKCLLKPKNVKPVYLTDFQISHKSIGASLDSLSKIELNYTENSITIYYSAQSYCQADKVRFTFTMEGMNNEWFTSKPGELYRDYENVAPGTYRFRVFRTGFPETEKSIEIIIHPPWWATTWAYLIYFLLGISALAGIFWFQLSKQRVKQEAENLKEIDQLKTKLYANITHEFRTPLTLILGLSEQLQKANLGEQIDKKIEGIKENGNRILLLVNQILDLKKLQAGKLQLKLVQKEVTGLLKYAAQNFEPLAQNKNIKLVTDISFNSLIIDHDPDKLITVISNLLDNAIKFTPENGQVTYGIRNKNNQLIIEVTDTGIGIAQKDLPTIFDRYVSTTSANYTSTGIGLSLAQALVQLMGGTIEVKSWLSKGTQFRVVLPITQKAIKVEGIATISAKDSPIIKAESITLFKQEINTNSKKPIILVVEDNEGIAQLIADMFDDNYQICYAPDGQAGMDKAMELIPDLIISDVMMPRMDGFEMCERLKEQPQTSHIPIIILTAKAGDDNKIAGLKRGADTYLTKPINQEELLLSVKNALESRLALRDYFSLSKDQSTKNRMPANPVKGIDFSIEDLIYQKVLAALEKHFSNPDYSLDELCAVVEMSRAGLNRKLKALSGWSMNSLLKNFRFEKAKELLLTTNKTISEVAFETGFKDPSYFTRVFKDGIGRTPSEFRETGGRDIKAIRG